MDINDQILIEADIIRTYIRKYLNDSLTEAETTQLWAWVNATTENKAFFDKITAPGFVEDQLETYKTNLNYIKEAAILDNFNKKFSSKTKPDRQTARSKIYRFAGFTAAASVILLLGVYYIFHIEKNSNELELAHADVSSKSEILPGKTGAILTLSDGSEVLLDSVGNRIITQNNGAAMQVSNGAISYATTLNHRQDTTWNTVRTPKGRQFKIILADNTVVWLNASSAITYPINFTGPTRNVKVEGEVYMEVAQNVNQPFFVKVNNQAMVEVLGTDFNINAYPEDETITTTLVEGSVKLTQIGTNISRTQEDEFLILKPNQQAIVDLKRKSSNNSNFHSGLRLVNYVNTEKIIAWKNGLFNFQDMDLGEVMKQLARWYDLEVVYENGIPDIEFYGKMDRGLTWNEVQRFLAELNVKFRVENNKRVVVVSK